jgi:hypothetical protein
MTDHERRDRHAKSMALYDRGIFMSQVGTVIAILGVAWWPLLVIAAALIAASMLVSRRADEVSPYRTTNNGE